MNIVIEKLAPELYIQITSYCGNFFVYFPISLAMGKQNSNNIDCEWVEFDSCELWFCASATLHVWFFERLNAIICASTFYIIVFSMAVGWSKRGRFRSLYWRFLTLDVEAYLTYEATINMVQGNTPSVPLFEPLFAISTF